MNREDPEANDAAATVEPEDFRRSTAQLDLNCEHRAPSRDLPARFVARARTLPVGTERAFRLALHLAC